MPDMYVDATGMARIIDETQGFIRHNGAAGHFTSYLGFCPETETAVVVRSNLSPRERIPAAVIGIKLLQEMQQSSTERKQASCRTQDMTQFCG